MNLCSYHLQEAGATPVQEIAFTLANACAILDRVKQRPGVSIPDVVGQLSFFVNAGIRFVEEMCKLKGLRAPVGPPDRGALRRRRRAQAALPLRRAGNSLASPPSSRRTTSSASSSRRWR